MQQRSNNKAAPVGINAGKEEKIMKSYTEIKNLSEKCGLFREFCKVNSLNDGDYYSAIDYLDFCDDLTFEQRTEITRKYDPEQHNSAVE